MKISTKRILFALILAALLAAAGAALAQSGQMTFSLNSPASFPVDI